ncbi:MAG: hypothetical protein RQ826_10750, partial [Xanthomonadales bacterium]|nr:hypothetical protein [Xanthomonadales bacterium]
MIEQLDDNGCGPLAVERLNIIGCGQAASSLAKLWVELGLPAIGQLLNRTPQSTAAAVRELRSGEPAASIGQMEPADGWLIGTPDKQIAGVAEELAAAGRG